MSYNYSQMIELFVWHLWVLEAPCKRQVLKYLNDMEFLFLFGFQDDVVTLTDVLEFSMKCYQTIQSLVRTRHSIFRLLTNNRLYV